jgi:hypothetical protein
MIEEISFLETAKNAYKSALLLESEDNIRNLIHPRVGIGRKKGLAIRFAQKITKKRFGKPVSILTIGGRLPVKDYASWLIVNPMGIAIDSTLVQKWSESPHSPKYDVQFARTIIHELGHIFATDEMLKAKTTKLPSGEYSVSADPKQEETAWVWAFILIGLALGDHAWFRKQGGNADDTVTISV